MTNLAQTIWQHFFLHGWTWKIDGEDREPTADDIARTLDRLRAILYDEEDDKVIEVGRIIMQRHNGKDGHYDVYTYLGEY